MNRIEITREMIEREYVNKPGTSAMAACKALGVCYSTFRKALAEYGIPILERRKYGHSVGRFPQLRNADWLAHELETKTMAQVARELGTSPGNVMHAARRLGVMQPNPAVSEAVKAALRKVFPNGRAGSTASNWRGGRRRVGNGYIALHKPDHPHRTKDGYIMEHRFVIEQQLGRYLLPGEVVHHKNGIRHDNRLENLEVLSSRSDHVQHHWDVGDKTQELEGRIARLEAFIHAHRLTPPGEPSEPQT